MSARVSHTERHVLRPQEPRQTTKRALAPPQPPRPPSDQRERNATMQTLSTILSPGGGEESGKGDARRLSLPRCDGLAHAKDLGIPRARCSPHGALPDPPAATARRRQASGSAMPRRRPSRSPLPCNGWCAPHLCHSRARVGRARGIPGSAAARGLPRALPRGIPGSAAAARAKRYDSPRGSCTRESPAKRAGSGRGCHYNIQLPIGP